MASLRHAAHVKIFNRCQMRSPSYTVSPKKNIRISANCRVRTDIKPLFSTTFQDLQIPNSRVFQDSKNVFSRTFQDTLRLQTWLHEVKKCTYQISFRCNCIAVNKPKYSGPLLSNSWTFPGWVFQDLCLFPGLSRPGNLNIVISGLFRTFQGLYEPCN